jgi:two-component system response regulator FixJ
MTGKPTIFVVDDDAAVQDSLRVLLESADHRVETYGSGLDFLDNDHDHPAGCLILDLDLPVMSGLEVLEALSAGRAEIPVILISGQADRATRDRALKTGAVALLEKPIEDGLLIETVARVLATNRKGRADGP